MTATFRQRCASALTHPVTIAALVVLLVNDLVFKALWSNPWTTGKLSDLAWVIFASPLLAFILAFAARRNNAAQRIAFITAYIGLPALYAAFNTFEPLHDLIISGLLLASGGSFGSPFDPTDSLAIPVGLAIALWVWRRHTARIDSLRNRLALLAAGIAAFATVATAAPFVPDRTVGHLDDRTLVLDLARQYVSFDGGLTWHESTTYLDSSTVRWGGSAVETPRGMYTIKGLEIFRSHEGVRETAYSPLYLQREADVRFQQHLDRRKFCPFYCPSSILLNIVYDVRSGNIVAATGAQGVVVGAIDGNWVQIAVGRFEPTDFSLRNKVNTLLDEGTFWLAAVALSVWGTALGLAILRSAGEPPEPRQAKGANVGAATGVVSLIFSAIALFIGMTQLLTSAPPYGYGSDLSDPIATASLTAGGFFGLITLLIVFVAFRPPLRQLPIVLAAFLGMIALFVLAFVIGVMQGFNLTAAKFYAVMLIILAALTLSLLLDGGPFFLPKRNADRQ